MRDFAFTWSPVAAQYAAYGGVVLGAVVATRLYLHGKVVGVSGLLENAVVSSKRDANAACFVGGLVAGGALLSQQGLLSASFESWESLPRERLLLAGALVGFGTRLGGGCTSGHGVCGISRFSLRGLIGTCCFMASGAATAVLLDTSTFLPVFENTLTNEQALGAMAGGIGALTLLVVSAKMLASSSTSSSSTTAAAGASGESTRSNKHLALVADFVLGGCFAVAMSISNMTKLSATISFLDVRYFNPALMFVMGGAISVSATAYALLQTNTPVLAAQCDLPDTRKGVDAKLIIGELIFGCGWGMAGACPGPALVNVGTGNILCVYYAASVCAGMWLYQLIFSNSSASSSSSSSSSLTSGEGKKEVEADQPVKGSKSSSKSSIKSS